MSIFKKYDIRGTKEEINPEMALSIGAAFGRELTKKLCMVGYDTPESAELAKNVRDGLSLVGIDAFDIGLVISPILYWSLHHYGIGNGVMLTASHLSKDYRGMKLVMNFHPFFDDRLQELEKKTIKYDKIAFYGDKTLGKVTDLYKKAIISRFEAIKEKQTIGLIGKNVETISDILTKLGFTTIIADVKENDNPDPTVLESYVNLLKDMNKCNWVFVFDNDCDRIGIIDVITKRTFSGDQLLYFFAKNYLKKDEKVIVDVKCSEGIIDALQDVAIMHPTGHSLIKESMFWNDKVAIAGEMSGHIYWKEWYSIDDAFYTALKFLYAPRPAELLTLPDWDDTPEMRLDVKFDDCKTMNKILDVLSESSDVMDGLRIANKHYYIIVRPSNTEDKTIVRWGVNNESPYKKEFKAILRKMQRQLEEV